MVHQLPCKNNHMCFPDPTTHIAEADANHHNPSQMLSTQRRQSPPSTQIHARMNIPYLTLSRPLSPSELQVLRAQYEKEGDMVGVQTKFNYAWVRLMPPHILLFPRHICCCFSLSPFSLSPVYPPWLPLTHRSSPFHRASSNQTIATTNNSASASSAIYSVSLPNVAANACTTSPSETTSSEITARPAATTTSCSTRSPRTSRPPIYAN